MPKRIGILSAQTATDIDPRLNQLYEGLQEKGWEVGHNLWVEAAYADWNFERLDALAASLVNKRVDVIVCDSAADNTVIAAARATKAIPIVFREALAPVEQGFVDSLARPGRNLTGTTVFGAPEFIVKRLEFLRILLPAATRVSWLYGADSFLLASLNGAGFDVRNLIESSSRSLGLVTRVQLVRQPAEVPAALNSAVAWGAQALSVGGSPLGLALQQVVDFALKARLPTVTSVRDYVHAGGLLSYGVPPAEYRALLGRWVSQIDQILRGARPASMPVENPSRYELSINAKTARSIGVTIPQSLLARADEVIR